MPTLEKLGYSETFCKFSRELAQNLLRHLQQRLIQIRWKSAASEASWWRELHVLWLEILDAELPNIDAGLWSCVSPRERKAVDRDLDLHVRALAKINRSIVRQRSLRKVRPRKLLGTHYEVNRVYEASVALARCPFALIIISPGPVSPTRKSCQQSCSGYCILDF